MSQYEGLRIASKGDRHSTSKPAPTILAKAAATPANATAQPKASAAVRIYTQADHDKAIAVVRTAERGRVETVFASSASHGREREAATLLTRTTYSADAITRFLTEEASAEHRPNRPSAAAQAKADAVWGRAYESAAQAKSEAEPAKQRASQSSADGVWDKAYAGPRTTGGQA